MAKEKKQWLQGAHLKKGALKKELGIPTTGKIPAKRLEAAEHSKNPVLKKRAILAVTLKKMSSKKGK
jgi:hypothetical protein